MATEQLHCPGNAARPQDEAHCKSSNDLLFPIPYHFPKPPTQHEQQEVIILLFKKSLAPFIIYRDKVKTKKGGSLILIHLSVELFDLKLIDL